MNFINAVNFNNQVFFIMELEFSYHICFSRGKRQMEIYCITKAHLTPKYASTNVHYNWICGYPITNLIKFTEVQ